MEEKLKKKLLALRLGFGISVLICLVIGVIFTVLFIQAKQEMDVSDPYQMDHALFFRASMFQCAFVFFYSLAFYLAAIFLLTIFVCHYVKIPVEFNEAYLYVGLGTMTLFINNERAAVVSTKHVLSIEGKLKDNALMEVTRTGQKQYRVKFSDGRPYLEIDAKTGSTKYFV